MERRIIGCTQWICLGWIVLCSKHDFYLTALQPWWLMKTNYLSWAFLIGLFYGHNHQQLYISLLLSTFLEISWKSLLGIFKVRRCIKISQWHIFLLCRCMLTSNPTEIFQKSRSTDPWILRIFFQEVSVVLLIIIINLP